MKSFKFNRIISYVLLFVLLMGALNIEAYAANTSNPTVFKDLKNHWAKEKVEHIMSLGFGNEDFLDSDTFKPNEEITRAEVVEIFLKANVKEEVLNRELKELKNNTTFVDISNHKLKGYIELAKRLGMVDGYEDNTFRPDKKITREELATIVVNSQDILNNPSKTKKVVKFSDLNKNNWSYKYVVAAANEGLVSGYPDGTFKSKNNITRAEAYTLLDNYYNNYFIKYNGVVGFISHDGKIVEGVTVKLIRFSDNDIVDKTVSNEYGQFRFDIEDEDDYIVKIESDSLLGASSKFKTNFKNSLLEEIIPLENNVKVTGTAYGTRSSIVNNGELVFQGKDIKFKSKTDNTGKFEVKLLPSTTYKVYKVVNSKEVYLNDIKVGTTDILNTTIKPKSSNVGNSSSSTPENPKSSSGDGNKITISIDQNIVDGVYTTSEEVVTITGKVSSKVGISKITYAVKSVKDDKKIIGAVEGIDNWKIESLPIKIGTNYMEITAYDLNNQSTTVEFIVDRLSKEIELKDDVKIIDENSGKEIGKKSYKYWSLGDKIGLIVENSNLLLNYKSEDVIMIQPNDYFVAGLTMKYVGQGKPSQLANKVKDEYKEEVKKYSDDKYKVVYLEEPALDEIFDGDVRIDIDSIDEENPIAFTVLPENTELYVNNEDEPVISTYNMPKDNMLAMANMDSPYGLYSLAESRRLFNPEFDKLIPKMKYELKNGKMSLTAKFGDAILIDRDGDKYTEYDQLKIGGVISIKDLNTKAGIEWHPSFKSGGIDLLPQQLYNKTTYSEEQEMHANLGADISTTDAVNELNKKFNSEFENNTQFLGLKVEGVSFDDQIVLGTIGLNLATGPVRGTLRSQQYMSMPINPVLVITFVMDIKGEISAKTEIRYDYNGYYEKGINLQKRDFKGKYGSWKENRGQKSIDIGFDRTIEIYDVNALAPNRLNEQPNTAVTFSGEGKASAEIGAGPMMGIMIAGFMPSRGQASLYTSAAVDLNGSAKFTKGSSPEFNCSGDINGNVGLELVAEFRMLIKCSSLIDREIIGELKKDISLLEFGKSFTDIQGIVFKSDTDRNNQNNKKISDVKVTLAKVEEPNNILKTVTTNGDGKYVFHGIANGTYILNFIKDGYAPCICEVNVSDGSTVMKDVFLDVANYGSLKGKITSADIDTNITNNVPVEGAKISIEKLSGTNPLLNETYTDDKGMYSFENVLVPGIYSVVVSKDGYKDTYQEFTMPENQNLVYNIVIEAISEIYDGKGTAAGTIFNVLTGRGVPGLTLKLRRGLDNLNPDSEVVGIYTTDNSGKYSTDSIEAGHYCVEIVDEREGIEEDERYLPNSFNIKVLGKKHIDNQNGNVGTSIGGEQLRIVLRWGEVPRDLDSHLVGPTINGGTFHTYYHNKTYYYDGIKYADLDLDDRYSWGPETTTIYVPVMGEYSFLVHDYTNRNSKESMKLANSGAYIQVFKGASNFPIANFSVPFEEGTIWEVFRYNSKTGEIIPVNILYYESSPSKVGELQFLIEEYIEELDNKENNEENDNDVLEEETVIPDYEQEIYEEFELDEAA